MSIWNVAGAIGSGILGSFGARSAGKAQMDAAMAGIRVSLSRLRKLRETV